MFLLFIAHVTEWASWLERVQRKLVGDYERGHLIITHKKHSDF